MSEEMVVDREVAESEFDRFCEAMDLDVDPAGMDDGDKRSFESARRQLIKAICAGHLAVDEQGQPVYTPRVGPACDPITFYEPSGASLMAMDQKKKGHDVAKLYATMADMTRQPLVRFSKMKERDLKVCRAVTLLFLG